MATPRATAAQMAAVGERACCGRTVSAADINPGAASVRTARTYRCQLLHRFAQVSKDVIFVAGLATQQTVLPVPKVEVA